MIRERDKKNFNKAWQRILSSDRILLISHINPDVDAISSLSIFIEICRDLNKEFLAFAENKSDDFYYIANNDIIISSKEDLIQEIDKREGVTNDNFLSYFDLIIVVDCGSVERTALASNILEIKDLMLDTYIIEIDHHLKAKTYADIEIKVQLASNTELIYHLLKSASYKINRNIANCILAGILTDTNNFLYPSVGKSTLKIASKMMSLGAQFPKLLENTWRNKGFDEMKLWGLAMDSLRINKKYKIAFAVLSYDDLKDYRDINNDVFGDIIAFMSSMSEAKVFLLIRESEPGMLKASLRVGSSDTEDKIDVTKLASYFGGGGHKKAAGFMLEALLSKNDKGRIFVK